MHTVNWSGHRAAAWAGIGLLAGAIVLAAARGKWTGAGVLSAFLGISALFVLRERQLPTLFDAIFVLAALINAGGWTWDLYNQPGLYDEVAHF